jgi:hypothetical protein
LTAPPRRPARVGPVAVSRNHRAEAPPLPHDPACNCVPPTGRAKYLTAGERDTFLREAGLTDRPTGTLRMTLAYAGCRLSEALSLTADRGDLAAGVLEFESLKKRRSGIFRSMPAPPGPARFPRYGAPHSRTADRARHRWAAIPAMPRSIACGHCCTCPASTSLA